MLVMLAGSESNKQLCNEADQGITKLGLGFGVTRLSKTFGNQVLYANTMHTHLHTANGTVMRISITLRGMATLMM